MHFGTVPHVSTFVKMNRFARKHMNDTPLLDIGSTIQYNFAPIPAQDCMWPYVAIWPNCHMTNEGGLRMDKSCGMHHRSHVSKGIHHDFNVGYFQ